MVTGHLGSAAAGLLVLENEQLAAKVPPEALVAVRTAQQRPTPRVAAGQWLAQQGGALRKLSSRKVTDEINDMPSFR
jgi:thiamine monophosphate kinase